MSSAKDSSSSTSTSSSDGGSSEISKPEVSRQTEFNFGDGENESDEVLVRKDGPVETGLDDFFRDIGPDENRASETRIEHGESDIFHDRRSLDSINTSEQETLLRPMPEDQQTLDGGSARDFTEVVTIAASSSGEDE